MLTERVTIAAGVPTVWFTLADELAARGGTLPDLRHIVCGGAHSPRSLIGVPREFGIAIVQAWGLTETSPLASMAWPHHYMRDWEPEAVTDVASTRAGLPLPGIEVSIRDDEGSDLPFDGTSMGRLHVRGPWVVDRYLDGEGAGAFSDDRWFDTGDVDRLA
jgi:fatty-acyl-CoA synthase